MEAVRKKQKLFVLNFEYVFVDSVINISLNKKKKQVGSKTHAEIFAHKQEPQWKCTRMERSKVKKCG